MKKERQELTGERDLWAAVLIQAAQDAFAVQGPKTFGKTISPQAIREDAWRWFDSDKTDCGSYLWICDQLDLDPSATRDRIETMAIKIGKAFGNMDKARGISLLKEREQGITGTSTFEDIYQDHSQDPNAAVPEEFYYLAGTIEDIKGRKMGRF